MNQAYGVPVLSTPCWAVPVLPPTTAPSIRAARPVPFSTASTISRRTCPAVPGPTACRYTDGRTDRTTVPSAAVRLSTSCGRITVPLLAMPAATIAITSGVAEVSNWPIEESASCASSIRVSKLDLAARTGVSSRASLKPKDSAAVTIRRRPTSVPSRPSTLLQLSTIAVASDWSGSSQAAESLTSGTEVPGRR